jgi:hypothetical protein
MKYCTILLLLICCTSATTLSSEKYYVTFVKGNVTIEKTKKLVKVGDVLGPDDRLSFPDKISKVSCINPTKGRFDISPIALKNGNGELYVILKSSLIPVTSKYSLSTRSIFLEGNDPASYFNSPETQNRILIIENKPFFVNSSYKMDKYNFFFIQYVLDGVTFTHKIQQANQQLFFSLATFEKTQETVTLCYQQDYNGKPKSSILAKFYPVLASEAELSEQIQLIKKISGEGKKNKLQSEVANHLFDNYGKIGAKELSELLLKL